MRKLQQWKEQEEAAAAEGLRIAKALFSLISSLFSLLYSLLSLLSSLFSLLSPLLSVFFSILYSIFSLPSFLFHLISSFFSLSSSILYPLLLSPLLLLLCPLFFSKGKKRLERQNAKLATNIIPHSPCAILTSVAGNPYSIFLFQRFYYVSKLCSSSF
jgi:hypothetical protein